MIDLVCVCVGGKYTPELHVGQLYNGIKKHLTLPYTFHVLTDNPNHSYYKSKDIVTHHVPNWDDANGERKYWWYKMQMYNPKWGFTGTVFYLDLDIIIVGNLDKFIDYSDNFIICQDFNRRWIKHYAVSNTSVMCFHAPNYYKIFKDFKADIQGNIKKFRGDQDYITEWFKDRDDIKWWPDTWCQSFKWECYRGGLIESGTGLDEHGKWPAHPSKYAYPDQPWIVDPQCSLVVFHGDPDPWITDFGKQNLLPNV
jgi:hypothetical protein